MNKQKPGNQTRKKLRAAAYCRVSTDMPSQESSITRQRSHWLRLIREENWELADIYWETGVSATDVRRPELQRLLADCRGGRVDVVLTKSISRFTRNTADCLALVRELTGLGVILFFEKENLRTDRMDSELLLTILAALAENESRSLSANMKWSIRKRFQEGTYRSARAPYGYRKNPEGEPGRDLFVLQPEEAETVREIFRETLRGVGSTVIARDLNRRGVPTWSTANGAGEVPWSPGTVRHILQNLFYTGDALYQKTYLDGEYRQRPNRGELDRYLYENEHPPIVDRETFRLANQCLARNEARYGSGAAQRRSRYCFSGRLYCALCGSKLYRAGGKRPSYVCAAHSRQGTCPMQGVYEDDLRSAFANLLNKLAYSRKRGLDLLAAETPENKALRSYVGKRGIRTGFLPEDDEAFTEFTAEAVVRRGEWVEFRLRCGLCLRESLAVPEGRD